MAAFLPRVNHSGGVILTERHLRRIQKPELKKRSDINDGLCDEKNQKLLLEQAAHKMAPRLLPAVFTHASSPAHSIRPLENTFIKDNLSPFALILMNHPF